MTRDNFHYPLWLLLLVCCLPAAAQDARLISSQPPGADVGSRTQYMRNPVPDCPELEQLGYRFRNLMDVQLDIRLLQAETPTDCSVNLFRPTGADPAALHRLHAEFNWVPTELFHQPLYFQDAVLERAGQAKHPWLQPWLSGAHFFGTFPLIPYHIGLAHPFESVSALGHYRPGSPTPCLGNRLPLEVDAASYEALTWVGLFFLLP